jgi:hypothetical protein
MTKDEALKMAIEALECIDEDLVNSAYYILVREAIPVCKEALATNKESLLVRQEREQFDFDAEFDAGVLAND